MTLIVFYFHAKWQRHVLRHVLNSPLQDIIEFDGQDGCGSNSWHMVDVDLPQNISIDPKVSLQHLKPWTQYAIFVKAITLQVQDKLITGAKSDIIYIRTRPSRKSVVNLLILSKAVCKQEDNILTEPALWLFRSPVYAQRRPCICQLFNKAGGEVVSSSLS